MALHLGDKAPNFTADSTAGEIDFHDWAGDSWVVFFSHPADFTPVCTTELGRVAQLADKWADRGVKPIALSVDSVEDHHGWKPDIEEFSGSTVDDMIHPGQGDSSSVRSVFVIDPAKTVRLTMTYPKSTGRNFDEIIRVVDALQQADKGACATPVDWQVGDKVIVPPTVSTEDAREQFDEVEEIKPYLRTARVRG
jgi:peroxiredoxin (alkyl hydroperoxide reductase subunit C)